MVAEVSGSGLGLFGTSAGSLGKAGVDGNAALGQGREQIYVNTATGNLVVQHQDEFVVAKGVDVQVQRTYNAQGKLNDDNADNWRIGLYRRVYGQTGTVNTAGSTITKVFGDGSEVVYTYDGSKYVGTDGDGAHDTLTWNATSSQWTWTDGSGRNTETYDSSGKLLNSKDADGNQITYNYTGTLLTSVVDAAGQTTYLDYTGNNLTQIRVVSNGVTQTLTRYYYDASNRLKQVVVDLTPSDAATLVDANADGFYDGVNGQTYVTNYTYDGTSTRVASITQSDKTTVSFTYVLQDGQYRVKTVTDGNNNVTTYTYTTLSTVNGQSVYLQTDVTDALGQKTTYTQDTAGRLTKVQRPGLGGTTGPRITTQYAYDAQGNVTSITEDPASLNRITTFQYDANGNLTLSRDNAGNTVTRTYSTNNQLVTETRYITPDPDGAGAATASNPLTTRYAYDAEDHLRFVISADGRVTEYQYNAAGQRTAQLTYTGTLYNVSALSATTALTEAQLVTWVGTQDKTKLERTDYVYDFRGNVTTETSYVSTDSAGVGATATASKWQYVYDQRGQLLQKLDARGSANTPNITTPPTYATSYTYDGLGRLLTTTDWLGTSGVKGATQYINTSTTRTNTNSYDDANNKIVTTMANGLITTTVYDKTGSIASVSNGISGNPSALGTTAYTYDTDGRLRMTTDPTGIKTFTIYDEASRIVGTVDGNGTLTELVYNGANQVIKTVKYADAVPAATLTTLATTNNPTLASIKAVIPTTVGRASDQITRSVYDAAGRLVYTIDPVGAVTQTFYDGLSRVTDTVQYGTSVVIASSVDQILPNQVAAGGTYAITTSFGLDRRTRNFYDSDGHLTGTLDGAGYLVEYQYSAAGRLVKQTKYATEAMILAPNRAVLRLTASLAQLRPNPNPLDQVSYFYYDGEGRQIGVLDAEGYLTETQYDVDGQVAATVRYNKALTYNADFTTLKGGIAATDTRLTTSYTYDGAGRVLTRKERIGNTTSYIDNNSTTYVYDAANNLISQTKEGRTTQTQYDALGRVTKTLSGEGSVALAALGVTPTQAQIDLVWARYGTSYAYDAVGRRTSMTTTAYDPIANTTQSQVTYYYYNEDGQLRFTVNALGERLENRYNALGQLTDTIGYTNRIPTTGLTGGLLTAALISTLTAGASTTDTKASYTYNLAGNVSTRLAADGISNQYFYNAFGQVSSTYFRQGSYFRNDIAQYDYRGLKSAEWFDYGNNHVIRPFRQYTYDAFGRVTNTSNSFGTSLEFKTYDRLGRAIQTFDALGNVASNTYDAFSRTLTVTDRNNNLTSYVYNDATRTIQVTSPKGTITRVQNALGETISVTNEGGSVTQTVFNKDGQVTDVTLAAGTADASTTHYVYDTTGRTVTVTEGLEPNAGTNGALKVWHRDGTNSSASIYLGTFAAGDVVTATVRFKTTSDSAGAMFLGDAGGADPYDNDIYSGLVAGNNGWKTITLTWTMTHDDAMYVFLYGNREGVGANNSQYVLYDDLQVTSTARGNVLTSNFDAGIAGWGISGFAESTNITPPRVTQYVYDQAGRRIQEIVKGAAVNTTTTGSATTTGAKDLITQYKYDGKGNLSRKIDPANNSTWYVYDADNRLTYTIDALGGVTQTTYNEAGLVASTRRYATAIAVPTADVVSTLTVSTSLNDRLEQSVYDNLGREIYKIQDVMIDGQARAIVTKKDYDAEGNRIRTVVYANDIPAANYVAAGTYGRLVGVALVADPNYDRIQYTAYDANNQATLLIDASGAVTQYQYDANGNVIQKTAFAAQLTAAQLATLNGAVRLTNSGTTGIQAWSNATTSSTIALTANATTDRTTKYWYDGVNRVRFTLDAEGYLTETQYDSVNRKQSDIAYFTKPTTLGSATTPPTVITNAADQKTTTEYDYAGRVKSVTDALNNTESYTYDVVGNKLSFTNKKGSVWNYQYDANHRLTKEISPAVDVTTVSVGTGTGTSSSLTSSPPTAVRLETTLTYDALGNVRTRTEAANTTEARTTAYDYDQLGRQVKVTFPPVDVYNGTPYNSTTGTGDVTKTGTNVVASTAKNVVLTSQVFYDSLGNAWKNVDVAGNASYKLYDRLGRVLQEVDAEGYVTAYGYDVFGNALTTTRHNNKATNIAALTNGSGAAAVTPDANQDRTLTKTYDVLNRVKTVEQPAVMGYSPNLSGTGSLYSAKLKPTTSYQYNAFGEIDTQTEKVDPTVNAVTRYFYDRLGNKRWTVDALGYVTEDQYDAVGNITRHIEYSDASPGWTPTSGVTLQSSGQFGATRTTEYVYDQMNRLIMEQWVNVQVSNSAILSPNGEPATSLQRVLKLYRYDALGNKVYEEGKDVSKTYTKYDALGRVIGMATPTISRGDGTSTTPYTLMKRDAYGNLVETVQYANGAALTKDSNGIWTTETVTSDPSKDRSIRYYYDKQNHLTQMENARGDDQFTTYTARGEVAQQWQYVTNAGVASITTDDTTEALVSIFQYDKLGRQTAMWQPTGTGGYPNVTSETSQYNAFGEITLKNGVEYFDYDQAGRVWRTNSGDGVDKVYLYNLQGKATATITASKATGVTPVDLKSLADASAAYNLPASRQVRQETAYDTLGRVTGQRTVTYQAVRVGNPVGTSGLFAYWEMPAAVGTTQTFGYRTAGSTGAFIALPISALTASHKFVDPLTGVESTTQTTQEFSGLVGAEISGLAAGNYEFQVTSTNTAGTKVSSGSFTVSNGTRLGVSHYYGPYGGRAAGGGPIGMWYSGSTVAWWGASYSGTGGGTHTGPQTFEVYLNGVWKALNIGSGNQGPYQVINSVNLAQAADGTQIGNGTFSFRFIRRLSATNDLTDTYTSGSFTKTNGAVSSLIFDAMTLGEQFYDEQGKLSWAAPIANNKPLISLFRYRPATATSWSAAGVGTLTVDTTSGAMHSVNLNSLPPGDYTYEIFYTGLDGSYYSSDNGKITISKPATITTTVSNAGGISPNVPTVSGTNLVLSLGAQGFEVLVGGNWTKFPETYGYSTSVNLASLGSGTYSYRLLMTDLVYSGVSYQLLYGGTITKSGSAITVTSTAASNAISVTDSGKDGIQWAAPVNPPPSMTVEFKYRLKGAVAYSGTDSGKLAATLSNGNYLVSVGTLLAGTYEYLISYQRADGTYFAAAMGTIIKTASDNARFATVTDSTTTANAAALVTDTKIQNLDRWGNALTVTDASGAQYVNTYNYSNQVISTSVNGVRVGSNYYDVAGRLIATQDGNGNYNRYSYNLAGQLVGERHADDTNTNIFASTKGYVYNAFGEQIEITDEEGFKTSYGYDKAGNLVDVTREVVVGGLTSTNQSDKQHQSYVYDQAGRRIKETIDNATINGTTGRQISNYTWYDLQGNIRKNRTNDGFETSYIYDARNNKTVETNPNGDTQAWTYDYFGRALTHRQLTSANPNVQISVKDAFDHVMNFKEASGIQVSYTYDGETGLLTRQRSQDGQNIKYFYDAQGRVTHIADRGESVRDVVGVNRDTDYGYDAMGRRVREQTWINGVTHQQTFTQYDSRGRISQVTDPTFIVNYAYDNNNNRTHIQYKYRNGSVNTAASGAASNAGKVVTKDLWYAYDKMNRVTVSEGVGKDASGNVLIDTDNADGITQGVKVAYDKKGNRISTTEYGLTWATRSVPVFKRGSSISTILKAGVETHEYKYDGLSRLTDNFLVNSAASKLDMDKRTYDGASRLISQTTKAPNDSVIVDGQGIITNLVTRAYTGDGRLDVEKHFDARPSTPLYQYEVWYRADNNANGIPDDEAIASGYDAAGNVKNYMVKVWDGISNSSGYLYTSKYKIDYRKGDSYLESATSVDSVNVATANQVPSHGETHRTYNSNGELAAFLDDKDHAKDRYFANNAQGQALSVVQGNYGAAGGSTINSNFQSALQKARLDSAGSGSNASLNRFAFAAGNLIGQINNAAGRVNTNFDNNYTGIDASFPAAQPSGMTVQSGDTLRIIAARVYGDSNLWYLIADENGLTEGPDDALTAGTEIRVPNTVASLKNDATTFKPFNAQDAIGDTTPTQPIPPPPTAESGGCGVLGQIIIIIITVIVTYYAGPIVANIVQQGLNNLAGYQDGFSLESLGATIATAGIMQYTGLSTIGSQVGGNAFTQGLVQGVVNSAVSQGVSIAFNLQHGFSWREIAISGLAGGATSALNAGLDSQYGKASTLMELNTRYALQAATNASVRLALGGKVDGVQVAADIFGNVIGNSIVDASKPKPVDPMFDLGKAYAKQEGELRSRVLGSAGFGGLGNNPDLDYTPSSVSGDQLRQAIADADRVRISQAADAAAMDDVVVKGVDGRPVMFAGDAPNVALGSSDELTEIQVTARRPRPAPEGAFFSAKDLAALASERTKEGSQLTPVVLSEKQQGVLDKGFGSMDDASKMLGKYARDSRASTEWSAVFTKGPNDKYYVNNLVQSKAGQAVNYVFDGIDDEAVTGGWHLHPKMGDTAPLFSESDYRSTYSLQKKYGDFSAYMTNFGDRKTYVLPSNLPDIDGGLNIVDVYEAKRGGFSIGSTIGPSLNMDRIPNQYRSTPTGFRITQYDYKYQTSDDPAAHLRLGILVPGLAVR